MDDLIKALTIFRKYANEENPIHCEHDVLMIMGVQEGQLTEKDLVAVKELGFLWGGDDGWISFRFGSA